MWPLVPFDLELLARFLRMPPSVGDDGYTAAQRIVDDEGRSLPGRSLELSLAALKNEHVTDAGQRLDLVTISALHCGIEHRALVKHGVLHAGNPDVNTEQWLPRH